MNVPAHIAIIMDGNGRWAKERGQIRLKGHQAGMEALHDIVKACSDMGVQVLTVYAFSTENWKRPAEEVSGIFSLLVRYVAKELKELNENNVRIRLLGDIRPLPDAARKAVLEAVDDTADNTGLVFNIAINYGGRAEIVRAAKQLAQQAAEGQLDPENITEDLFAEQLYTADLPDPDLIIRTGGELRLSNFLTWQSAYSEIYVTDTYWPDFTPEKLTEAIESFNSRDRRFGGIKA
ncbi:MAG: isoprenyl transferase [Firmicutes bacterium]|nr:isoprenyl transferase [Bacillota bacterium]MBQ4409363.1 isoprenyl transferase [Bacillota bacterium]MBR0209446.1 isoprenyl transferase [Bacillota bacterium]